LECEERGTCGVEFIKGREDAREDSEGGDNGVQVASALKHWLFPTGKDGSGDATGKEEKKRRRW
jgi:hypothetical protein